MKYHTPHFQNRCPMSFYDPRPAQDLSVLALSLAGLETEGTTHEIATDEGQMVAGEALPEVVSMATDIWIVMKRKPGISQAEAAKMLGISQSTLNRRLPKLRELLQMEIFLP